jgi:hypothetical protein
MDKATTLLNDNMTRVPTEIDQCMLHLKELYDERFVSVRATCDGVVDGFEHKLVSIAESIQKQFEERDVRSRASESAANTAVNAALQAQKEAASAQNEAYAAAIAKSEVATVKQIDGILALLASGTKALTIRSLRSMGDWIAAKMR